MAELTQREKLLVTLLSTIINPQWTDKPWQQQYDMFLQLQAIYAPGKFSDDEIEDLVLSVRELYDEVYGQAQYKMKVMR